VRDWDADVVVVGVGIWGACTLWRLAHRGVHVIGVEQFVPGHGFGSSFGGTRMFRLTCLEHPRLTLLARRSRQLWTELARETGRSLLHTSGGVLIGPHDGSIVRGTLRAAAAHGVTTTMLSPAELTERFPAHSGLRASDVGVWEPSAGVLPAEEAVLAAVDAAIGSGAKVLSNTRVHAIRPMRGGVCVSTGVGSLRARKVVVTVGSWLPHFVPELPLRTGRFPVAWFAPTGHEETFRLERLPVFMRELPNGSVLWGNGHPGWSGERVKVKLGLEMLQEDTATFDPDQPRVVADRDWQPLAEQVLWALPGLRAVPIEVGLSMATATPDGQFVLGQISDCENIIVAGGCNAHGFKHAPAIGDTLADLTQGRIDLEIAAAFISIRRFANQ
jgi:sarcosine oxidase